MLKIQLKEKKRKIIVKSPFSLLPESNWGYLSITSLDKIPIFLSSKTINLKIRFQPFTSGANFCEPLPYRLDSHSNKPLHSHFYDIESPLNVLTLNEVLLMVLGSDYKFLEKSSNE